MVGVGVAVGGLDRNHEASFLLQGSFSFIPIVDRVMLVNTVYINILSSFTRFPTLFTCLIISTQISRAVAIRPEEVHEAAETRYQIDSAP